MRVSHTADSLAVEPFISAPDAVVVVPGSKSITNRALITAALADGTSVLRGALFSDDTEAMIECLASLGIAVTIDRVERTMTVAGCGGVISAERATLNVRQSGTTARFIVPVVALGHGSYVVDAHPQMRGRPMAELAEALAAQGIGVKSAEGQRLPFAVSPGASAPRDALDVGGDLSSQFLSGLLLSAPYGRVRTFRIVGPLISRPYVDMTCSVMSAFGVDVLAGDDVFAVPSARYRASDYTIEPDASAASYFFGLAAITGGRVRIDNLGTRSVQGDLRFVHDLEQMGCTVTMTETSTTVQGPPIGELRGGEFDMREHSDTAPTMAAVAAFANAPVTVRGVGFIRHKESDRIGGPVRELNRCGITAVEHDDGFTVDPTRSAGGHDDVVVETYDDHRMAMSFALLGCRLPGIRIANPRCVEKTFPEFFEVLESVQTAKGGLV